LPMGASESAGRRHPKGAKVAPKRLDWQLVTMLSAFVGVSKEVRWCEQGSFPAEACQALY